MSDLHELRRSLWLSPKSRLWLPKFNNQFSLGGSDCGCCTVTADPCAIFSDDFDRADNASPGADWSEENGQVAISSNKLAYVSGSDVACISTTTHTSQDVTITVDVRQTGFVLVTGTEFRVILSYTDANNYWYAALKIGTSQYLRVVHRSGGSDTVLDTTTVTTTINTTYTITACMSGAFIYATCTASGAPEVFAAHSGTSGEFGVGFGAADIFSSFDNFVARAVDDTCEDCERPTCTMCTGEGIPDAMEITITGIVNGSCTDCANLNGTFILTPDPESPCIYSYQGSDWCGSTTFYYLWFGGSGGSGSSLEVQVQNNGVFQTIAYETLGTISGVDCRNLVAYDVPWFGHGTVCDGSASTCTVTSL